MPERQRARAHTPDPELLLPALHNRISHYDAVDIATLRAASTHLGPADAVEACAIAAAACRIVLGITLHVPQLLASLALAQGIHTALRAHLLLHRDRDYVVRPEDGTIGVVDELTGRVLPGRRWSEGLHQAVEAKEHTPMTTDRRPLGRITVGNYFRGYDVLVGMSGTLEGAEAELLAVYNMPTLAVPTNRSTRRVDHPDLRSTDQATKLIAVADDTAARHQAGQPVLVGTVSIAQAGQISSLLDHRQVPHRVLTARNDAAEAEIIAIAGRRGAVTVTTQMAGRGVDVIVDADENLMVWGVEHHSSRRLDLQLRGRTGRQGAPGETRFAVADDEPLLSLATNVDHAQQQLEQLDASARRDSRFLDGPIDAAHNHVYEWRLHAADLLNCRQLLSEASQFVSQSPSPPLLSLAPLDGPLPATSGRRQRELRRRIAVALERRRRKLPDETWDQVTSAVLRRILLDLWTDALDHLDSEKNLERISHLFGVHPRAWSSKVERRYATFRRRHSERGSSSSFPPRSSTPTTRASRLPTFPEDRARAGTTTRRSRPSCITSGPDPATTSSGDGTSASHRPTHRSCSCLTPSATPRREPSR